MTEPLRPPPILRPASLRFGLLFLIFNPHPAHSQTAPRPALDDVVMDGIRRGIYPGAVVVVGRADSILYQRGYGHLTWNPRAMAPTPDSTLWDLASLSKVVATTSSVMRLVESGRVALDSPVVHYLPRFGGGEKAKVTVRMLLDHTSGLRSYVEFFRLAPTRDSATTLLYAEPLRRPPGASPEYSDLNALLLGLLVERVSGEPLDAYATREVFAPLSMTQTIYRPSGGLLSRTAPTGEWAGKPVGGVVNDQNAVRFEGVAGHAGVFSTGRDLARYAQMWLRQGEAPGGRLFRPATIRAFLTPSPHSGTRLLGWDRPDSSAAPPTPYGERLSPAAYGHTGWTGSEIWVDPAQDLFLVFLTNRSYAPKVAHSIPALRAIRGRLSDAVVETFGGGDGRASQRVAEPGLSH